MKNELQKTETSWGKVAWIALGVLVGRYGTKFSFGLIHAGLIVTAFLVGMNIQRWLGY